MGNFVKNKRTLWSFTFTVIIMAVWITILLLSYKNFKVNEASLYDLELRTFDSKVNSVLRTYEAFSNYIFQDILNNDFILTTIDSANSADEAVKDILRKSLYHYLEDEYAKITDYNFRQLHFHLLNMDSFLRMHRPENFGDNLAEIRSTIKLANSNNTYITGFEEGRIFNGYRFVYPLNYNDNLIGTAEVSISTASILEILSSLYQEESFQFLIKKEVVDEKIFDNELSNYADSSLSDLYYTDLEVDNTIEEYCNLGLITNEDFMSSLKAEHEDRLKKEESFAYSYTFNQEDYIIIFYSIENLNQDHVAYFIAISKTSKHKNMITAVYRQTLLITAFMISVIVSVWVIGRYQKKIENAANIDFLTKLYNRHKFFSLASREIKRMERYQYPVSVVMIDIDHFKYINDAFGHDGGDLVLKALARLLMDHIRASDILARWGGEEFVLLLPHTNAQEASQLGEKMRLLVEKYDKDNLQNTTISIGISCFNHPEDTIESVIDEADLALYYSKENGRNQVNIYTKKTI